MRRVGGQRQNFRKPREICFCFLRLSLRDAGTEQAESGANPLSYADFLQLWCWGTAPNPRLQQCLCSPQLPTATSCRPGQRVRE